MTRYRTSTAPQDSSEAQVYAGWTTPPDYKGETMTRAEIAEQARLAGIRRRRIEDILEASRLETRVLSEVWDATDSR